MTKDRHHLIMGNDSSSYGRELDRGFPFLRFSKEIEQEFRESYGALIVPRVRVAIIIAVLIILFYEIIDRRSLPANLVFWTSLIRFGIILPVLTLSAALTFIASFRRRIVSFVILPAMVAGLGTVLILLINYGYGQDARYHSLILATTVVYFLSGLLFRASMIYMFSVMVLYVAGGFFAGAETPLVVSTGFFLLWMNMIGASGSYIIERATRVNFLQRRILKEISEHDGLTGIYNRRAFDTSIMRLWRHAARNRKVVAMMMVDVDHFKLYNDTHGHIMGDECLRLIASVLARYARRPLDFASRYGGEEFALFWFDTDASHVREMAEGFRAEVESLCIGHSNSPVSDFVTVSAGCALILPGPDDIPEELIRQADSALYLAKNKGRNMVVFEGAPLHPHGSETDA